MRTRNFGSDVEAQTEALLNWATKLQSFASVFALLPAIFLLVMRPPQLAPSAPDEALHAGGVAIAL
jgi:hypothetical protein